MQYLDLTLPTAAENLAADEALLEHAEGQGGPELLRFWEPADYFVVVGYANAVAVETHRPICERQRVPILRRCSGGGTVLQGPGCLNYALILRIDAHSPLQHITSANRWIMQRNRSAIESLLRENQNSKIEHQTLTVQGHTDLAMGDRKFSGNAQRRKKQYLLFHGTFLLHLDLERVEQFLPAPSRPPDYRGHRGHREFLSNLELPSAAVKSALREAWDAVQPTDFVPTETIHRLTRDKYVTNNWNLKF